MNTNNKESTSRPGFPPKKKKKKPSTLGGIEIIRKREKTSISLSVLIVHVYL